HGGKKKSDQYGDDRDHHEQLNQRKTADSSMARHDQHLEIATNFDTLRCVSTLTRSPKNVHKIAFSRVCRHRLIQSTASTLVVSRRSPNYPAATLLRVFGSVRTAN